ncbi:hypothetical protein II906_06245 [bacterium]|nr:hypothetical protein [bacterium]
MQNSIPAFNSGLDEIPSPLFGIEEDAGYEQLAARLQELEDNNGSVLSAWDKFKNTVNIGSRSEKCEEALEKYKNGEMSFEEASESIEKYGKKQDNSLNLFANIATSIVAIGAATLAVALAAPTGGLSLVAVGAIGAGAGALTKAGFKAFDKATNKVKGDITAKQVIKDGLSGAVTGAIASVTMGTAGSTFTEGAKLTANIGKAAANCAKRNAITGAISGSANYAIDCSFDKDKKMTAQGLVTNAAEGAAVGAAVGAIMGTHNTILRHAGVLKSGGQVGAVQNGEAVYTSGRDIAANSICTAEYKTATRAVRDMAGLS